MRYAAFVLMLGFAARVAEAQDFKPSEPGAKGEEIWVETSEDPAHPGNADSHVQIHIEQPRTPDGDPEPPRMEPPAPPPPPEDMGPPAPDVVPDGSSPPAGPVSLDEFMQELSQYGAWVTVEGMGKVWRPYPALVGYDFQPYVTAGHWAMTEYGWTWVSDFDWGWATFHYGRWWLDPYYGWVWYPGFSWGPAWVTWWFGDGLYGWIPTVPFERVYGPEFTRRVYCFVDGAHFTSAHVRDYAVPAERVEPALKSATVQAAPEWKRGPPVEMISHAQAQPVHIEPVARSGAVDGHPALKPAFRAMVPPPPKPNWAPPPRSYAPPAYVPPAPPSPAPRETEPVQKSAPVVPRPQTVPVVVAPKPQRVAPAPRPSAPSGGSRK